MAGSLPSTAKQAEALCAEAMARLKLSQTGGVRFGYEQRYTGAVAGLWVAVDVAFGATLGAAYFNLRTVVNLEPGLGLGLSLRCGERYFSRDDAHLPEPWRSVTLEGAVREVRSTDPAFTRHILGVVAKPNLVMAHFGGPTELGLNLLSLTDVEAEFLATQLPDVRDLTRHVEQTAAWCAQLVATARDFLPEEHEAFPDDVWEKVARAHGGRVDLRSRCYRQSQHAGTVTFTARWLPKSGYELAGRIDWPALSFEKLSLEVKAARSWLKRIFATDIEVGDAELDDTFLIDGEPADRLPELLTSDVRGAALRLASVSSGLKVGVEGADFVVGPPDVRDTVAADAVDAATTLLHAGAATRDRGTGAYR